jgi:DNA-binding CsgD family transcriptional regulator
MRSKAIFMFFQFNDWFKQTAVNLIAKQFMEGWGDLYDDIAPADPEEYLKSTHLLNLMGANKNTIYLLFDVKEFKILFCSNNFETMSGFSHKEFMEKNTLFFFGMLDRSDLVFFFQFSRFLKRFHKAVPIESQKEFNQIQWSGLNVNLKDGSKMTAFLKIMPFAPSENGLGRLCLITVEDVTSIVKKGAPYWARMEVGLETKYVSCFFENNTKFALKDIVSERELEILIRLAKGQESKEIAQELFISAHTVDTHRKNMYTRLGAKDSAGLMELSRMCNLI